MPNPPNTVSGIGATLLDDNLTLALQLLAADGYVYLSDVSGNFDYVSELARIGEPSPQYGGSLIRDVRPEPDMSDEVYSASNTRELSPHTESYEFEGLPPRYVALWCVHPADGPGGETTLADGHRFLRQFSAFEQQWMRSTIFEWRSNPSLECRGVRMSARHPILDEYDGELIMRHSSHDVFGIDRNLPAGYLESAREFFESNKLAVRIERNAILIWDNWRMLHSRNSFSDRRRHLRRLLIAAPIVA